ncbi:hypothetical protein B0A48_00067 [Cryoendolithus antarcticus]|uniref:Uncharacterized protein n=1 Tax=Cryoendolithus antarcticus TaxID=1507870 RepID=A0A1V8TTK3_9PEZI|nr:hypothetical protein B0A48_00067 [Cryoendolithus antarcticus]
MKNEQRMDPQGKYEHLDNMWNWIKTDLTPGLGLNTQRVDDPLATAAYITIAMDLLRTDATIRQLSFGDPKEIHHFALRILLQQDTACRIGDVTNLKWHQIQFFLFPQGEDGI